MNKKIKIVFVVLFFVTIIIGIIMRTRSQPEPKVEVSSTPSPTIQAKDLPVPYANLTLPKGDTITIDNVEVKNIYDSALRINDMGDVLVAENNNHRISYLKNGDYFIITILGTPFEDSRSRAEKDFLKKMEIDEDAACKLDVRIGTPYYVNAKEAGNRYKLSFCE